MQPTQRGGIWRDLTAAHLRAAIQKNIASIIEESLSEAKSAKEEESDKYSRPTPSSRGPTSKSSKHYDA